MSRICALRSTKLDVRKITPYVLPMRIRLAIIGWFIAIQSVAAQDSSAVLQTGMRARLTAPNFSSVRIMGKVTALDADSLTLDRARLLGSLRVPMSAITYAERSAGHNRLAFTFLGALVGMAGGALVGAAMTGTGDTYTDQALAPIGGAFVGFFGGAFIGAVAAPERWKPVRVR